MWIIGRPPIVTVNVMPDTRETAQMLRGQAERCRRWAREMTNVEVRRKLVDLATQFEEEAATLEKGGEGYQHR
jgi:hypothetical protein